MTTELITVATCAVLACILISISVWLFLSDRRKRLNLNAADIELYNGIKVYTHGIKTIQPIDVLRLTLYTSEWISYQLKIDSGQVVKELADYELHFHPSKKNADAYRKIRGQNKELHVYYPGTMTNSTFFPVVVNLIYSKFDIFKEKQRCLDAINSLRSGYYS